jgi:hypothetical protein
VPISSHCHTVWALGGGIRKPLKRQSHWWSVPETAQFCANGCTETKQFCAVAAVDALKLQSTVPVAAQNYKALCQWMHRYCTVLCQWLHRTTKLCASGCTDTAQFCTSGCTVLYQWLHKNCTVLCHWLHRNSAVSLYIESDKRSEKLEKIKKVVNYKYGGGEIVTVLDQTCSCTAPSLGTALQFTASPVGPLTAIYTHQKPHLTCFALKLNCCCYSYLKQNYQNTSGATLPMFRHSEC